MIFSGHIPDRLSAYLDGELHGAERARVDAHLERCEDCRLELDRIRQVSAIMQEVPLLTAPEDLWSRIEAAADKGWKPQPARVSMWRYAVAAVVLLTIGVGFWRYAHSPVTRWDVVALQGSPQAGDRQFSGAQSVAGGQWIETDTASRARIRIGQIGSVEVEPNSRVRLVESGTQGHRLALAVGGIHAKITAPPRLFFVDTPAGTAVDLGCEYQMSCDRSGTGLLKVSSGWVSLEWRGYESLVPAGASCRMRPGFAPGTPWFDDASPLLEQSLNKLDFDPNAGSADLDTVLIQARARDTLTLWHLLSRVSPEDRVRVCDRMYALAPPPAGVARDKILMLDQTALKRWKDELAWIW